MHRSVFAIAASIALAGCGTSSAGSSPGGAGLDSGADDGGGVQGDDAGQGSDATVPTGDAGTKLDGGAEGAPSGDGGPGPDTTVNALTAAHLFFKDWSATGNQRVVTAPATFPSAGTYSKINLHVTLSCPTGGCDVYDRFGTIGIVTNPGTDASPSSVVEVARFITGFCVGNSWDYDVTDLRPLLTGPVTLEAFIDTWVPQGTTNLGQGWSLTATFQMTGGVPAKVPIANIPVWPGSPIVQAWYGDPSSPISSSVPPQTVSLPAGATSYSLRSFVTGHGQGNADNCSEFCSRQHTMTVGSTANTATIWRTNCGSTKSATTQCGTWTDSRAGWCPDSDVTPWIVDVSSQVGSGPTTTIAYDVEGYPDTSCGCNTCRPGAVPDGGTCAGCVFQNTTCNYDGSAHTQPFYYVSSLLVAYR